MAAMGFATEKVKTSIPGKGCGFIPKRDPASVIERLLKTNEWGGSWRDRIYPYHHYHNTAHEVLAVFSGSAKVQLGGELGTIQPDKSRKATYGA